jgi:topoisomerase IV subunit A
MSDDLHFEEETNASQEAHAPMEMVSDMYKSYFLDYASYVILERAIPAIEDGLKPVQRRILHAMHSIDDGRYNKVANIIGQTMQYHPHGDAAIGDALVNMGQKDLLIDCQGNWGDVRTGDSAAAARYIEARLSKFALDIAFNPKTTLFQRSYDGRKKEPTVLPMKFPLLLAQGVEGIAVGLATKILPHNFCELIQASIDILNGKPTQILPDFPTGGMVDCSNYHSGRKGSKVRVRAKIEISENKKALLIRDIPFGTTTTSLIDSVLKANAKNKIKIKKIVDNTAKDVEIFVELAAGMSPEQTIDALYAFSDCEVSISPNICVIGEDKPIFTTVDELLAHSAAHTKFLLEWELKIEKKELEEKWHFASLERLFIEKKMYKKIEDCETWEEVLETIAKALKPFAKTFIRPITQDDIIRLTEIRIKRISKFNKFQADEYILQLEQSIAKVVAQLADLNNYAIAYYQNLLKKYGHLHPRRTQICSFDVIQAAVAALNNEKLYINREEGFMGYGLKKDEYIEDCSDIDEIIIFNADGTFFVTKIAEKVFIGKNPLFVGVWRKGDERKIYNMAYTDLEKGGSFVKRFAVLAITRDKKYPVADGVEKAKILHFSANANGEAEIVSVQLTQSCSAKKKEFDYNFTELEVKGRGSRGNLLTKYPIRKIKFKKSGFSTLGALRVWLDENTGKLATQAPMQQGRYLGQFEEQDRIVAFYKNATYQMHLCDLLATRFDVKETLIIEKFRPEVAVTVVYFDGERQATFAKRFLIDTTSIQQPFDVLPNQHAETQMLHLSTHPTPKIQYQIKIKGAKAMDNELNLAEFVDVMSRNAVGKKISDLRLLKISEVVQDTEVADALEVEAEDSIAQHDSSSDNLFD